VIDNSFNYGVLVGHSHGGYVALAMIKKRPDLFSRPRTFSFTAYADSDEKKQSREKAVEFVNKNGAKIFATNFIAQLFFRSNHVAIEKSKKNCCDIRRKTL
jgi:pimeloyl-ACP methyl ester carboxylesterase